MHKHGWKVRCKYIAALYYYPCRVEAVHEHENPEKLTTDTASPSGRKVSIALGTARGISCESVRSNGLRLNGRFLDRTWGLSPARHMRSCPRTRRSSKARGEFPRWWAAGRTDNPLARGRGDRRSLRARSSLRASWRA